MSNNDWYEDDDDFYEEDAPQREDSAIRKVRKAERAKDKQLKEALAELETLRKFQREVTLKQVLQEKNINPKIAAFIPADIASDSESINAWIDQYGDVFGVVQQQAKETIDSQDLAALRQIDSATSNAFSPDDVSDAMSMINNAQSMDELMQFLYSQGE